MEKEPKPEKIKISKDEVVKRLRDKGFEDPETKAYFLEWLDQEQAEVGRINTSRATLEFNVTWAEVYRDAGMTEAAIEAFEQAAEQAWQERDDALYEKLLAEVAKLRQG